MNIWAIADPHGCYTEMMLLYKKLLDNGLNPEKDIVIFTGDYIDRGYQSKQVIDQLIKWHKKYPNFIFLFGNHEDILRNYINKEQKYQEDNIWSCFIYNGGQDTLNSYKDKIIPKKHLDFLFKETKILYETKDYVFVHGGLVPELPISEHLTNDTYINAILWAREGFINSNYDWHKKVIFGHTPAYKKEWGQFGYPIVMKNKIGIDCACCPNANQRLCAIKLPEEKFFYQESLLGV